MYSNSRTLDKKKNRKFKKERENTKKRMDITKSYLRKIYNIYIFYSLTDR